MPTTVTIRQTTMMKYGLRIEKRDIMSNLLGLVGAAFAGTPR